MSVSLCIDRFEGRNKELAVLVNEDGLSFSVPRSLLPEGAKAGDALSFSLEVDSRATQELAQETQQIQKELQTRDPGGDLQL